MSRLVILTPSAENLLFFKLHDEFGQNFCDCNPEEELS
jgi:hypothetical protein